MLVRLLYHVHSLLWWSVLTIHYFVRDNWDVKHICFYVAFSILIPVFHGLHYALLREPRDMFPIYISTKPEVK